MKSIFLSKTHVNAGRVRWSRESDMVYETLYTYCVAGNPAHRAHVQSRLSTLLYTLGLRRCENTNNIVSSFKYMR